jgi:hypothetical protein
MATKEVLDTIEETIDTIEETLDVIDDAWLVFTRKQKKGLIFSAVLVGSGIALAAATTGYLFAQKKLKAKYEKISEQEISEAKQFYAVLNSKETPGEAVERLIPSQSESLTSAAEALRSYQGEEVENSEPDVVVEVNVFERAQQDVEDFDIEEEMKNRTRNVPYIIHHDEYMEADPGYPQQTLTYYEGDDTLTDEQDTPIIAVNDVIGEGNLRFGYGSGDSGTVFIRNDKLSLDFEVVKSDGKYAHEVLGFEHSDMPGSRHRDRHQRRNQNRKFRDADE